MKQIQLHLYHSYIDAVSDRTFREFLKGISKLMRQIQSEEMFRLVESFELGDSEMQSLRDRLKGKIKEAPTYYLKHAKKGSLELLAIVGAGLLIALVGVVGELGLKPAKLRKVQTKIAQYVKKERSEKLPELIENKVMDGDSPLAMFEVSDVETEKKSKHVRLNLTLETNYMFRRRKLTIQDEKQVIADIREARVKLANQIGLRRRRKLRESEDG